MNGWMDGWMVGWINGWMDGAWANAFYEGPSVQRLSRSAAGAGTAEDRFKASSVPRPGVGKKPLSRTLKRGTRWFQEAALGHRPFTIGGGGRAVTPGLRQGRFCRP